KALDSSRHYIQADIASLRSVCQKRKCIISENCNSKLTNTRSPRCSRREVRASFDGSELVLLVAAGHVPCLREKLVQLAASLSHLLHYFGTGCKEERSNAPRVKFKALCVVDVI